MAWQLQRRLAVSAAVVLERVGLDWISRVRMAESRSLRAVEAPCMGIPPDKLTLALGAGEEVRDDVLTLGRSEIREPAADGGSLGDGFREDAMDDEVGIGTWRASGVLLRASALARGGSFRWRLLPAM